MVFVSQPNSPMPARKTIDHKKHHDDEDTFSVASSYPSFYCHVRRRI